MPMTAENWTDYPRIQALIAEYVWALDTADIDRLGALFTDDAIFEDTAGNVYEGREAFEGYFRALMANPVFRGRQHHIDNLLMTPTQWGYATRSYWTVTKWHVEAGKKIFEVIGHSTDDFRRTVDGFRFCERRVHYWRDADCPWAPDGTAPGG